MDAIVRMIACDAEGPLGLVTSHCPTRPESSAGTWSQRYSEKHRLRRITRWPPSIVPPRKVRVYLRADHYVLQWWDPQKRGNLSDHVDGDIVAATRPPSGASARSSTDRAH